ncbi:MAG: GDSL-type esterase/lipase family protein [Bacilli bacterium]
MKKKLLSLLMLSSSLFSLCSCGDEPVKEPDIEEPGDEENLETPEEPFELVPATLYAVGDSTLSSFNDEYYYPRYGYATQLSSYFDSKITITNLALSGRSSKSFLTEDNYETLKSSLKEGDYLLIGFGHNDEKSDDDTRFTDASKSLSDESSFSYNLYENYIKLAIDKGATPILCTPIVRANKDNNYNGTSGHITETGDYRQAIIDLGASQNVQVIDLTSITKNQYIELGYSEAIYYHAMTSGMLGEDGVSIVEKIGSVDTTHLNIYGAKYVAYQVAKTLKESTCTLGHYVLDNISEPTKENYLVKNPNYVYKPYSVPGLSTYGAQSHFKTISEGWYGTAFGDCGADPSSASNGYKAYEDVKGEFIVGQTGTSSPKGKVTSSSEGIAGVFTQISKTKNFVISCDALVTSEVDTNQEAFGLMLRDDLYLPIKDATIKSNYVASGMYTKDSSTHVIYSRENEKLSSGTVSLNGLYQTDDVATLKIERIGQVVICSVTYNDETYSNTYTDFDFTAIDNDYMYIGMYATRGTLVKFTNVNLTITGEAQEA